MCELNEKKLSKRSKLWAHPDARNIFVKKENLQQLLLVLILGREQPWIKWSKSACMYNFVNGTENTSVANMVKEAQKLFVCIQIIF